MAREAADAARLATAPPISTSLITTIIRAGEATKNATSPRVRWERASSTPVWASAAPQAITTRIVTKPIRRSTSAPGAGRAW